MKTQLERYKKALEVAMLAYRGAAQWHIDATDKQIEGILNPPVEMEDVTIERWSYGSCMDLFRTEEEAADNCGVLPIVKLTGTLTRPKPVPVERSVSVQVSNIGVVWNEDGTPCHEVCGKKCTLTFEVS